MPSYTRVLDPDYYARQQATPEFPFEQPQTKRGASGLALYELDLSDVQLPPVGPQVSAISAGGIGDTRAIVVLLLALVILGGLFYAKLAK